MSSDPRHESAKPTTLVTWLALLVGGGMALVFATMSNRSLRGEGTFCLSHRQGTAGNCDRLRFELPAGWWIQHNGRQPWRGGTIADPAGRPRIEVWLHEGKGPAKPDAESCEFPWGRVTCLTWSERMDRPFNSFPSVRIRDAVVVERAFLLKHGYVSFRVPADQDVELKWVIWECMRSLRPGGS